MTYPPPVRLVVSPCPNDTFIFGAWIEGRLPDAPPVRVEFHDVDEANALAEHGGPDVVKVSFAALPWLLGRYRLLDCGGAVGRGCGPLVLSRDGQPRPDGRIAVPGERTTAYLLLRLWAAGVGAGAGEIVVMPFADIMPAVRDGAVDAGLVIHEARFTYPRYGLQQVVDLGAWWEGDTGLPIPLGAILVRRDLDPAPIADTVRRSLRTAWADPLAVRPFVLAHADEADEAVTDQHIALYVNDFSLDLGEEGRGAAKSLLGRAATAGLVPPVADLTD